MLPLVNEYSLFLVGLVVIALVASIGLRVALGNWGFPSGYGWFVYSIGAVQSLVVLAILYFLLSRRSIDFSPVIVL